MIRKVFKGIAGGIAWGCTIACVINIIGSQVLGLSWFEGMKHGYTGNVIASVVAGIGWVLPSIVYQNDKLPFGIQALTHLGTGFIIWFSCAVYMGWLPVGESVGVIAASIGIAMVIAIVIWACFYFYYKNEAKNINIKLKDKFNQDTKSGL